MKFLVEILGMTNQCNLRCTYCDWEKDDMYILTEEDKKKIKKNILKIKTFLEEYHNDVQLIEYSGGETLMYPEIVEILCDTFKDKWLRIISNGVLVDDRIINIIKNHKKVFMAISLDGNRIEANRARFGNSQMLFNKVLDNIDILIENKIPVMILCTLSKFNIDYFPEYVKSIEKKYEREIAEGMLVMPAHYVTNYSKDNGVPSPEQVQNLKKFIYGEGKQYMLINRIQKHYDSLVKYAEKKPKCHSCTINEWNLSMHFRGKNIIDGKFLSFGCGMRGVMENGLFDINNEDDMNKYLDIIHSEDYITKFKRFTNNGIKENEQSGFNELNEHCDKKCFVDWTIIDYIINGKVNYEDAEEWFVMFKDQNIKNWVMQYAEQ